jgi:hypothetical protein
MSRHRGGHGYTGSPDPFFHGALGTGPDAVLLTRIRPNSNVVEGVFDFVRPRSTVDRERVVLSDELWRVRDIAERDSDAAFRAMYMRRAR